MKRYTPILVCSILGLFLAASALIGVNVFHTHAQTPVSTLPSQTYAPYDDVLATSSPTLTSATKSTGVKYYTLAFITNGGSCQADWGGTVPLSQEQIYLPNLESDIQYVRSQGGDVIVSFGGEAGQELALGCTDVNALQAQYQAVIDKYNLTHIDFDIEGGAEGDTASVDRRNQALAALQAAATNAGKQLDISYTLPVMPTGLTDNDINLVKNAASHGVNVSVVNMMTMDYGTSYSGDMGQYAIQAANSLFNQLKSIYPSKSDAQLWAMVGLTPMIGQNDTPNEVFTLADAQSVLSFAQSHQIGRIAMWALSRDNGSCPGGGASESCSGISQQPYAFSQIFNQFTNGSGTPPTPAPTSGSTPTPTPTQAPSPTPNPSPTPGSNQLTNPGFETGNLSGWSCASQDSVVSSPVHSGSHALQVTPTNSDTGQCQQTVAVQPNHTYTLRAYVQGNYAYLGVNGSNSTWTSSSSYTPLSVTFTTGASTTSVTIYIHGWYAQGNVYADDFSLN